MYYLYSNGGGGIPTLPYNSIVCYSMYYYYSNGGGVCILSLPYYFIGVCFPTLPYRVQLLIVMEGMYPYFTL